MITVAQTQIDALCAHIPADRSTLVRFNTHADRADRLHEMFIAYGENAKPVPHRHVGKDESLHCLSGGAECLFYFRGRVNMGDYASGRPFYCRIPSGADHRLSEYRNLTMRETVSGPWFPEDTIAYLPGDICEDLIEAQHPDTAHTLKLNELAPSTILRVTEEAFVVDSDLAIVGNYTIKHLKSQVAGTSRKRIRLCTHRTAAAKLHEMFIVYTDKTYVHPHKHLAKDESFHILEGACDLIFFNDSGDVTEIIEMAEQASGKPFYTRIPADVYHTMVMRSDLLAFHCATPGPFVRDHTMWAPWRRPNA